jgi:uncharacterized membrane protein
MNINNKSNQDINKSIYIFFVILIAFTIRWYNINYENLWFDEILSYWIADPNISIKESLIRHKSIEQIPFLYHLILKLNFYILSYEPNNGRYLSLIFNLLGILFSTILCRMLTKNNAYILALTLFALNIFLINYAQEMRPYSMVFFICSWCLYLFFKIEKKKTKKFSLFYFIIIVFSQILMVLSHPFCFILLFCFGTYLLMNLLKSKKNSPTLVTSFILLTFFSIIYLYQITTNLNSFPDWLKQPDIKFFTNFYFSNFFGSRIMGLIHLISLIVLTILYFKNIIKKKFFLIILYLIIIFSYALPLVYGLIYKPIIFPRYIIFVLIPVIILISILCYEIKYFFVKKIFILMLILLNVGNHFTESTFKQFIEKRPNYKPNFKEMNKIIYSNKIHDLYINTGFDNDVRASAHQAIFNYISRLNLNKKFYLNLISNNEYHNLNNNKLWIICLSDISKNKCKKNLEIYKNNIIKIENISGIQLILIDKKN